MQENERERQKASARFFHHMDSTEISPNLFWAMYHLTEKSGTKENRIELMSRAADIMDTSATEAEKVSQLEALAEELANRPQKTEDMPEFQNALSQSVIKSWRKRFPNITDEEIIETLQAW